MKRGSELGRILTVVSGALLLLLMVWADSHLDAFQTRLLYSWAINAIFAVSFTLIYGHAGQFSLAHAGLAAVGAYVMALLTLSPAEKEILFLLEPPMWPISVVQWPFVPSMLVSGLITALIGLLIGAPALRLRGDYFCMATLGFSELIRLVFANLPRITNGAMGLRGIPRHAGLAWAWGLALLTIGVTKRLADSSYGRAIKAVREDEIAAEAAGVSLFKHKLLAMVVSSFFVGIGGALLAQLLATVEPRGFTSILTYGVITIAVLGGLGSISGSVIASGIYTLTAELLRAVESPRTILGIDIPAVPGMRVLIFSVMLLLLILFYRKGLMGAGEFNWDRLLAGLQSRFGKARREGGEA
jgi:branched-chain amino acid transport system permease protein